MTIEAALMGDPEALDETRQLVAELRRQKAMGALGQLTGDPLMARVGQGLTQGAERQATALRKARQFRGTARPLGQGFFEQGGEIKQLPGWREAQERELQGRVLIQAMRNRARGQSREPREPAGPKPRPLPTSLERTAQAQAGNLENLKMLRQSFKPEFTQPLTEQLGPLGEAAGPLHALPLWAARTTGLGTERAKDTEAWHGAWKRFMTLPVRNEMFGATLTPSEQRAWDAALEINPGMTPQQIESRIDTLTEEADRSARRRARTMETQNYFPGTVESIYGNALPDMFPERSSEPAAEATPGVEDPFPPEFDSAEAVRAAFQEGRISEDEATRILQEFFGFE